MLFGDDAGVLAEELPASTSTIDPPLDGMVLAADASLTSGRFRGP